ncbi:MAG TPA: LptE family protein [Candidatus Anammoximicrobium sp.]|nr:LptE family protein [Candidatus Anammoximicrobium sp.]
MSRIRCLQSMLVLAVALSGGCASYQVGQATLFRPDIRTVHVPVFESDSLRRNLGERLTEAVIKEIESRSPYKVVGTPDADSILSGRIVAEAKRAVAENRNDDVRDLETEMTVEVRWISRRGEMLMQRSSMPFGPLNMTVAEDVQFFPEAGQSLQTAQQMVIEHLAREIVGQMEIWW